MEYVVWAVSEHDQIQCAPETHEAHEHALRPRRTLEDGAFLFQALGSIERLQIMERLMEGEHCVSELSHELNEKDTTVSQRLQQLHRARLLRKERRGKHIYYAIADEHVRSLLNHTFDHVEEERLK